MENGKYVTKNGSTMIVMNGKSQVEFDWFEEDNACCDCVVEPYDVDGYLVWNCNVCGGGEAKLERQ